MSHLEHTAPENADPLQQIFDNAQSVEDWVTARIYNCNDTDKLIQYWNKQCKLSEYLWGRDQLTIQRVEAGQKPTSSQRQTETLVTSSQHLTTKADRNSSRSSEAHLEIYLRTGEENGDAWYLFYLLKKASAKFSEIACQIEDNDGQFIVIEAALTAPQWLQPANSGNRVWIKEGEVVILRPEKISDKTKDDKASAKIQKPLTSEQALKILNATPQNCSNYEEILQQKLILPGIQSCLNEKIKNYPDAAIERSCQLYNCVLPLEIACLLEEYPHLVSEAMVHIPMPTVAELKDGMTDVKHRNAKLLKERKERLTQGKLTQNQINSSCLRVIDPNSFFTCQGPPHSTTIMNSVSKPTNIALRETPTERAKDSAENRVMQYTATSMAASSTTSSTRTLFCPSAILDELVISPVTTVMFPVRFTRLQYARFMHHMHRIRLPSIFNAPHWLPPDSHRNMAKSDVAMKAGAVVCYALQCCYFLNAETVSMENVNILKSESTPAATFRDSLDAILTRDLREQAEEIVESMKMDQEVGASLIGALVPQSLTESITVETPTGSGDRDSWMHVETPETMEEQSLTGEQQNILSVNQKNISQESSIKVRSLNRLEGETREKRPLLEVTQPKKQDDGILYKKEKGVDLKPHPMALIEVVDQNADPEPKKRRKIADKSDKSSEKGFNFSKCFRNYSNTNKESSKKKLREAKNTETDWLNVVPENLDEEMTKRLKEFEEFDKKYREREGENSKSTAGRSTTVTSNPEEIEGKELESRLQEMMQKLSGLEGVEEYENLPEGMKDTLGAHMMERRKRDEALFFEDMDGDDDDDSSSSDNLDADDFRKGNRDGTMSSGGSSLDDNAMVADDSEDDLMRRNVEDYRKQKSTRQADLKKMRDAEKRRKARAAGENGISDSEDDDYLPDLVDKFNSCRIQEDLDKTGDVTMGNSPSGSSKPDQSTAASKAAEEKQLLESLSRQMVELKARLPNRMFLAWIKMMLIDLLGEKSSATVDVRAAGTTLAMIKCDQNNSSSSIPTNIMRSRKLVLVKDELPTVSTVKGDLFLRNSGESSHLLGSISLDDLQKLRTLITQADRDFVRFEDPSAKEKIPSQPRVLKAHIMDQIRNHPSNDPEYRRQLHYRREILGFKKKKGQLEKEFIQSITYTQREYDEEMANRKRWDHTMNEMIDSQLDVDTDNDDALSTQERNLLRDMVGVAVGKKAGTRVDIRKTGDEIVSYKKGGGEIVSCTKSPAPLIDFAKLKKDIFSFRKDAAWSSGETDKATIKKKMLELGMEQLKQTKRANQNAQAKKGVSANAGAKKSRGSLKKQVSFAPKSAEGENTPEGPATTNKNQNEKKTVEGFLPDVNSDDDMGDCELAQAFLDSQLEQFPELNLDHMGGLDENFAASVGTETFSELGPATVLMRNMNMSRGGG